jgi:hypothetical protein
MLFLAMLYSNSNLLNHAPFRHISITISTTEFNWVWLKGRIPLTHTLAKIWTSFECEYCLNSWRVSDLLYYVSVSGNSLHEWRVALNKIDFPLFESQCE